MSDTEKDNIYQKLMKARLMFLELKAKKSGYNPYSKYYYYELADFLPDVMSILYEVNLCSFFNISNGIATLKIINIEEPKQDIIFESPIEKISLKGCSPLQELGATHTYMKRYLYMNAFEIVEPDDIESRDWKTLLEIEASSITDEKQLSADEKQTMITTINNAKNIEDLNIIYSIFKKNVKDTFWKTALHEKSQELVATYDKKTDKFCSPTTYKGVVKRDSGLGNILSTISFNEQKDRSI